MNSIQGNIVVRRVRQGDTLTTRLESDKVLYQGIADGGWLVNPDWSVAENQPTITPIITSSLKDSIINIVPGTATWMYNGLKLIFGDDGICTGIVGGGTAGAGLFKLDSTTGSLKIINNLASSTNSNVDKLRFDALVNTGYETEVGADIDVRIELVGKNSYTGVVDTTSKTFREGEVETITANSILTLGISSISAFKTEWMKGETIFKAISTDNTCDFSRSDVNGSQNFTANFYVTIDGVDKLVSSYIFVLYDSSDPYVVILTPINGSEVTDTNTYVQIQADVIRRSDNIKIPVSSWEFDSYNCRAKEITLETAVGTTADGHKYATVTINDCDRVESGETEQNGDISIAATATI